MHVRIRIFLLCCVCSGCVYYFFYVAHENKKILVGFNPWTAVVTKYKNGLENRSSSSRQNELLSLLASEKRAHSSSKIILVWTPLYEGWELLPPGKDTFRKYNCEDSLCEITYDRKLLSQCHAVVFHIRTFALYDVPEFRAFHQKWIFFSMEAPPYSYFPGFQFMVSMFNWTMTYRRDSDVVVSYGRAFRETGNKTRNANFDWDNVWRKKTKIAIWMVSHCNTSSNREGYVKELLKYMDIDVIGSCGSAVCPFNKTDLCLKNFAEKYKFFFAFENGICDDYVTEKFYRILRHNIVPVVLGGANYKEIAPPRSYVNALDFTPKNLAQYLHSVAANSSLYVEYLKWKEYGFIVEDRLQPCALCSRLHAKSFHESSVYNDITDWWLRKSNCRKWNRS